MAVAIRPLWTGDGGIPVLGRDHWSNPHKPRHAPGRHWRRIPCRRRPIMVRVAAGRAWRGEQHLVRLTGRQGEGDATAKCFTMVSLSAVVPFFGLRPLCDGHECWCQNTAEIVRRRSFGGVLPRGRTASINGSQTAQTSFVKICAALLSVNSNI